MSCTPQLLSKRCRHVIIPSSSSLLKLYRNNSHYIHNSVFAHSSPHLSLSSFHYHHLSSNPPRQPPIVDHVVNTYCRNRSTSSKSTTTKDAAINNKARRTSKKIKKKTESALDEAFERFMMIDNKSDSITTVASSSSSSSISINAKNTTSHSDSRKQRIKGKKSIRTAFKNDDDDLHVFVSCLPGLEPYLYRELLDIGILSSTTTFKDSIINSGDGGISFITKSQTQLLSCHLYLGTASHILLRVNPKPFPVLGMEELYRKVSKLKFWKRYIPIDSAVDNSKMSFLPKFNIRVSSSKSRLYHTKAIAERVERGILDALELDVNNNIEMQRQHQILENEENVLNILVRIVKDQVQISIDTSSTPLHRRGYRLEGGKAPLREDIAYSLLHSAGWGKKACFTTAGDDNDDRVNVGLLDPFCGSGTIIIEGVSMFYGLPPGRLRTVPMKYSLMENKKKWDKMVQSALVKAQSNIDLSNKILSVLGTDRNEGVISSARNNSERAGVADLINFEHSAISSNPWLERPASTPKDYLLVATNPPFGHRLSSSNNTHQNEYYSPFLPLYQTLNHRVERLSLYNKKRGNSCSNISDDDMVGGGIVKMALLTHKPTLVKQAGMQDLSARFTTQHGGLNVCALTTEN